MRLAISAVEEELASRDIALDPGALLTSARTVASGDVTGTTAFREGRVRLQDEGSQLVAEIAAARKRNSRLLRRSRRQDADLRRAQPASPHRGLRVESRSGWPAHWNDFAPLGARIDCRLADATALGDDSSYDAVLADVPCSGTGTLGRNPEIRHRLNPEDLAAPGRSAEGHPSLGVARGAPRWPRRLLNVLA